MKQYMKRLAVLEGAKSQEIFDILYPKGKSAGDDKTRKAALRRMIEISKLQDQPKYLFPLPDSGYSGKFESGNSVLVWSYPHRWVALYKATPQLVLAA